MKRLIVTSDDCGLSRGINLATVELYEKGLVTGASVMTNFPATQHALDLFSRHPTLEVGVHLNLTDGFPLTQVRAASSLTRADRRFRSPLALFVNALVARPSFREQAGNELTAQINVVFQAGVQPQHLTTHIHFQTATTMN